MEVNKLCKGEKKRGKHLEYTYKNLLTIRPTSVESERAFSAAAQICTKFRTSLSDESLNNILFFKSYFNEN
jgi:hypothetical protein